MAGREALAQLLRDSGDVDAVVFSNDDMAVGGFMHCLGAGIAIPERLALFGFNGLDIGQALPRPLSTIRSNRFLIGRTAAETLLAARERPPEPQIIDTGFEIVEVPEQQRVFILNIAGPHSWRVIYTDGRAHPPNPRPTYLGHSVGRWEGNTLVIDTVGFNEKQWMVGTYPTTERLHLIERISRPDVKTLTYEAIIDDPGAYTAPWSVKWTINATTKSQWIPDGEIFEYICQGDN